MKRLKVVGGVAEEVEIPPEEEAALLAEQQAWESGALDRAKLARRAEINRARDAAEAAGFTYLDKPFDSNAQAIKRLYGAAMAAQSAIAAGAVATDPFVDWTCADGTVLTMTYTQTAGVIAAMAAVGNALHIKARTLKAQIEAATTVGEVEAIQW